MFAPKEEILVMNVQAVSSPCHNSGVRLSPNVTLNASTVSSDVRESHNAFVSFVKGMIERVVSSIKGIWKSLCSMVPHKKTEPKPEEKDPVVDTYKSQLQKPVLGKLGSIKNWEHLEPVEDQETELRHPVTDLETPPIKNPTPLFGLPKLKKPLSAKQMVKFKEAVEHIRTKKLQTKKTKKLWKELTEPEKRHRIVSRFLSRLKKEDAVMTHGIFRESGTYKNIQDLNKKIKNGKRIPKKTCVYVVADAFKEYIKENFRIFDADKLLKVQESLDKVKAWQDLIASIDSEKQEQLKRIFRFFAKTIVPKAEVNEMTAENFGKTPGECFIIQEEYDPLKKYTADELKMLAKARCQPQQALTFLIKKYDKILGKKAC